MYLVRGFVLFIVFVEPNKPKKLDEPDPRHAPRNGSGHSVPPPTLPLATFFRAPAIEEHLFAILDQCEW